MLNEKESLLMARHLVTMAGDRHCNIEVFDGLINRLRKSNIVEYYYNPKNMCYVARVNNQTARDYI